MGSAYGWLDDQDVHCYNVIPMEITQQICDAIAEGRRQDQFQCCQLTVWKISGFFCHSDLREINFGETRTSKIAIFATFWALNFAAL